MDEGKARDVAISILRKKGYEVEAIGAGQGVPRTSRLSLSKGGETRNCAVKVSEGGRISFTRTDQGSYKVLSEMDWVIHVTPEGRDRVRVSVFDARTVEDAFEKNYEALVARGMSHIPQWVNPEHEDGWRLTGSGFGSHAVWSEVVPLDGELEVKQSDDSRQLSLIDELKLVVAARTGHPTSAIEIDVRIKS